MQGSSQRAGAAESLSGKQCLEGQLGLAHGGVSEICLVKSASEQRKTEQSLLAYMKLHSKPKTNGLRDALMVYGWTSCPYKKIMQLTGIQILVLGFESVRKKYSKTLKP